MTEREAFETWFATLYPLSNARVVREWLLPQDDGAYDDPIERHWLAWQASRKQALEEAHDVLGSWESADTMRLRAGEMTAQEVRSVKAILGSCQYELRDLATKARTLKKESA